jgi:oligopeptide transport system substrate-binding protein
VDAARQRLAQAGLVAVLLLGGCGSSPPPQGGSFRLALPVLPRTLDPAKAADMPSLNVVHELYAGLTRFSGRGVVPDLAQSWDVEQGGLVWVFHLRENLRWSDDRRLTARDFRHAWLRALAPATKAPLAGPDLGIIRGARAYHATGRGAIGIQALDDRTLRVTLQHPIPWLDQLVAYPIAAPFRPDAYSGPFRLTGRSTLERNFNYWNLDAVRPSRLVFTTQTKGADAILPRGLLPPGLPWVATAKRPSGARWKPLPTLSVGLLWITTRLPAHERASIADRAGDESLQGLVPLAMPGRERLISQDTVSHANPQPARRSLAYTTEAPAASTRAEEIGEALAKDGVTVERIAFPSLQALVRAKGFDLVLLGWSSKIFDEYNFLDLFPCGSAFNLVHWCDPSYGALMRRAVRTLDDAARWRIERRILVELRTAAPVVPVYQESEYVWIRPGVRGFAWSPIGFYELAGMTRS